MKSNAFKIVLFLFINSYATLVIAVLRDPFHQSDRLTCQAQTQMLISQILDWQFIGMVQQSNNQYRQIWLTKDNQWLAITDNLIPNELFPWSIESLQHNKIFWQAQLAHYCPDKVTWIMPIHK